MTSWWRALFEPKGVAVVGSTSPGKLGRVLLEQLLAGGYEAVYAVNPRGDGRVGTGAVEGATSVQDIVQRGGAVDLVVVASPASTVTDVLEDAGRAGAHVAVVITAGFSEAGNASEEEALLRTASSHGMRIVGPNCAGIVNTGSRLHPTLETRPPAGDVAFVSQSGALGGAVLSWAEVQGVGFSKFVSYGNGADLTEVDFLEGLRRDDATRVVCLYLETVSDGRRFLATAARLAEEKPLIVIKAGRSKAGGRAARSHTGSMAGAEAVYDAALAQCGALRVEGLEEMFDLCRAFTGCSSMKGRRLAIVTNSGGPAVLATDRAEGLGLAVDPPPPDVQSTLEAQLPAFCSFGNPFDLTVGGGEEAYRETICAVAPAYDAVLALNVNVPYLDVVPLARGVVDAARTVDVPVVASFLAGRTVEKALPILAQGGVPAFATGERAVAALSRVMDFVEGSESRRTASPLVGRGGNERASAHKLPWERPPSEPEALAWLGQQGVPVLEHAFVRSASEAVRAARAIGFPLAIKIVSRRVLHKTEMGGVELDVRDPDAVFAAFERLERIEAGDGFEGVLVVRQILHPVEALVGLSRDRQFGPVVAVGLGGTHTEILEDVALRIAPIDESEALRAIDSLRGAAILRGLRGAPRDVLALARLVSRVSHLGVLYPDLAELDLNPVFVFTHGCAAADARVLLSPAEERSHPS